MLLRFIFLAFAVIAGTVYLCAETDFSALMSSSDIAGILKRGQLVVGIVDMNRPPFASKQADGQFTGIEITIAKELAKELGVPLVLNTKSKSFNELIQLTASGELDMAMSKLSRTLDRSKLVIFSEPYITLHRALLMNRLDVARRRGDRSVQEYIRSFDGRIGVIPNSAYIAFAREMFPKAEIVEYKDWNVALDDLMAAKLTAVFRDDFEIKSAAKRIPASSIQLQSAVFTDTEDSICVAFPPGRTHLRYWVNFFLSERHLKTDADGLISNDMQKQIFGSPSKNNFKQ